MSDLSLNATAPIPESICTRRSSWSAAMASMNARLLQGSRLPRACSTAITSVAASAIVGKPCRASASMMVVLPEPGAPVSMKCFIEVMFLSKDYSDAPFLVHHVAAGHESQFEDFVFDTLNLYFHSQ